MCVCKTHRTCTCIHSLMHSKYTAFIGQLLFPLGCLTFLHATHTYTHTYTHTQTHTHTHTYTHIYTHIHTYIHRHIHTHKHIHTHIHTYTHIYTHTYTHIHTHIYIYDWSTLLYSRNQHNIVKQLPSNFKKWNMLGKEKKKSYPQTMSHWGHSTNTW